MKHRPTIVLLACAVLSLVLTACASPSATSAASVPHVGATTAVPGTRSVPWDFNATIIEACSCPMFCQCYFNSRPAGPGCCSNAADPLLATRFCKFNNVFHVNHGSHGDTKLDGVKFWVAGDLGADFSSGEMNWAVVHFDPAVTKAQRDAVTTVLTSLYPVKWSNFRVAADAAIEWKGGKDRSEARLDGGKMGEVVLKRNQGMTDDPIVIHNLKYWGAPRNDGFVLMQNEVEAYRAGDKPYEFKETNGFMITVDIASADTEKR